MTSDIRVLVADDQPLIRNGISAVLTAHPDIIVVGQAADAAEAVKFAAARTPDVVVLEMRMPGVDGAALVREIIAGGTTYSPPRFIRVLAVAAHHTVEAVAGALHAGASGFLLKNSAAETLAAAVRAVAGAGTWLDPVIVGDLLRDLQSLPVTGQRTHTLVSGLTTRERDVLTLLAHGLDTRGIARRLMLSEATIRTHVGHILDKLGCHSRTHAVVMAYRSGLVRLTPVA
jgi:DNA-binding NarL/FixJ family response regulator